jgi:hypothetical protein
MTWRMAVLLPLFCHTPSKQFLASTDCTPMIMIAFNRILCRLWQRRSRSFSHTKTPAARVQQLWQLGPLWVWGGWLCVFFIRSITTHGAAGVATLSPGSSGQVRRSCAFFTLDLLQPGVLIGLVRSLGQESRCEAEKLWVGSMLYIMFMSKMVPHSGQNTLCEKRPITLCRDTLWCVCVVCVCVCLWNTMCSFAFGQVVITTCEWCWFRLELKQYYNRGGS